MSFCKMPIAEYVYTEFFKEMNVVQDVYLTFNNKKNSNDKFLYVYGLLKQYDWLPTKISGSIKLSQAHRRWRKRLKKNLKKNGILINMDCSSVNKNNNISDLHRSHGNDEFKMKNYEESLKLYTRSIMTAEIDSLNYFLSVANRSAALYYLNEYEHSIKDIDQALASKKYPLENKYKLYERKGNCYQHMNYPCLALEMYSNCLIQLNNTQLSFAEKEKMKIRISRCIKKCEEVDENTKNIKINSISFSGNKNDEIPGLSKFVEIKYSKEMGRGLYVSKNIKPGEILIIEKPVAGILKNNMWIFNCGYCLKRCLSSIPCPKCSHVVYCDKICLLKAHESYHRIECSLVQPLKGDPTVEPTHDLAIRCFIQMINANGIDRYCSMVQNYGESKVTFDKNNKYLLDTFHSIYALKGNETKRTVSNMFFMYCTASMIVSLLLLNEFHISPNVLSTIGESLVHLLCITNLNSYASVELPKCIAKSSNIVFNQPAIYNSVSLILCPMFSLINHSCDPSVIVQTYDGIEVTRAIQPILKGSQVNLIKQLSSHKILYTDYGVNFMTHYEEDRSKHLLDQYQFKCRCQACMEHWPCYSSLELNELYIKNLPHHKMDKDMIISKLTLDHFNKIVHLLSTQHELNVDYLDFLFSFLDLLSCNFEKPSIIYYKCIRAIQKCLYFTSDQLHYIIE